MTLEELAATCDRLARTQRNLPLYLSEEEHQALRDAADQLRKDAWQEELRKILAVGTAEEIQEGLRMAKAKLRDRE